MPSTVWRIYKRQQDKSPVVPEPLPGFFTAVSTYWGDGKESVVLFLPNICLLFLISSILAISQLLDPSNRGSYGHLFRKLHQKAGLGLMIPGLWLTTVPPLLHGNEVVVCAFHWILALLCKQSMFKLPLWYCIILIKNTRSREKQNYPIVTLALP